MSDWDWKEWADVPDPIWKDCKCMICGKRWTIDISLLSSEDIADATEANLFNKCYNCRTQANLFDKYSCSIPDDDEADEEDDDE